MSNFLRSKRMSNTTPNINNPIFSVENISTNILPSYTLSGATVSMVKFKDTDKQRAVYRIDCDNKSYCLKKIYFSEADLLYVYSSLEWLSRHDLNVPKLLPTKDGGRYVKYNNMLFILTPWIEGVKCDFDNLEHVIDSIKELSKFHKETINFTPIPGSSNRHGYDDYYISTKKHFEQLLQTANQAFNYKDKFSRDFLDFFDENLLLAKLSLETSSLIDRSKLNRSLCHGDYVNKNIIFSNDNKVWVIDFDKCQNDYCAHDLSYFMRRLLKRDNTNWDLNLAISIIKAYNSTFKLTESDLRYIVAYICFPQKYWKISRDYYKNIKKCNKNAFLTLLNKSNVKIDSQIEFAYTLINKMDSAGWNADKLF